MAHQSDAKILIVDDDPVNLSLLFSYLNKLGFTVFTAQDGTSALEQIPRLLPDLVLLDILMPEVDGFEICRQLKIQPATAHIPIIFMTALTNVRDLVTGFQMGAVDYIMKPFSPEEILARISTHLTLQQQQQELRHVSTLKDQLFALVASDLKEMLSTLVGLSDFLVMSVAEIKSENIQKAAKMVETSVQNATKLLENLSHWANIHSGAFKLQSERLDLHEVVLENIVLLRTHARNKQIHLSHSIQPQTFVYTDHDTVSLVLRNLLVNALWFTNAGGQVTVTANVTKDVVEVSVSDTGIGISADQLVRLFHIDQKVRRYGTNGEHGTGLGLVLCKDLIELNGGQISVNSAPQHGSCFTFTLPRAQNQEPSQPAKEYEYA